MIEIKVQVKFSMKFIYPFLEFIPLRTIITMESRSNRNLVKLWGKYLRVKYKLLHSQLLMLVRSRQILARMRSRSRPGATISEAQVLINKSMKIASGTDEGIIMRRVYNRWIVPFLLILNGTRLIGVHSTRHSDKRFGCRSPG